MLREITREQLAAYPSRAIGVLGVAGGDGLDLIDPATTDVVYGYDITRTIARLRRQVSRRPRRAPTPHRVTIEGTATIRQDFRVAAC